MKMLRKLTSVVLILSLIVIQFITLPCAADSAQAVAEVRIINGMPRLFINGQMNTGNLFFLNGDTFYGSKDIYTSEAGYAAAGGFHTYSTIYNIDYTANLTTNASSRYTHLRLILDNILDADPAAMILLRISTVALASQLNEEATNDSDTGWITLASDKWERETVTRISDMIDYILSVPRYAQSVYGYHLDFGEWFPRGFTTTIDTCATNMSKFRTWLAQKYGTTEALQEAWHTTAFTLDNAVVPSDMPINSSVDNTLLLDEADQRYIDYNRYWSELTASRIEAFGKGIKNDTDGKSVVFAFYGYYFEQYHATTGHWALNKLLASPYIDGFASPTSYRDRGAGTSSTQATSAYMSAADTIVKAGKLWLMESDQRTFINRTQTEQDVTSLPPLASVDEIKSVHRREAGIAMVHGTAMYPMDLCGYGWYDDAAIWKNFGQLDAAALAYEKTQTTESRFEVALVVDEKATASVGASGNLSCSALADNLLNLYRSGVSFRLVELNDVLNGNADDCKLYLFANPHALTADEVTSLSAALHKDNKTAVYLYSFGNLSGTDMKRLTGMDMATTDTVIHHILTVGSQSAVPGLQSTSGCEGNPKTVCNSYTEILGTYTDGTVGMALCESGSYNSIFYGSNQLSIQNIRAFADYAGVNRFTDGNDTLTANQDMVVLSARASGTKTVSFDRAVDVYDYFENRWYENVTSVSVPSMYAGETRWFFYGSRAELEDRGIPVWPDSQDTVRVTGLSAMGHDLYGITEVLVTLDSAFTQSYDAINSGIASPVPPDSLVRTVNERILINGISAEDYNTAIWGYLGESNGFQQFSLRIYDNPDTGERLCSANFTIEFLSGATDSGGNRIVPCKYQYFADSGSFVPMATGESGVNTTGFALIDHRQFGLTEVLVRLDSLYSKSLYDFQSEEHCTGEPTSAQLNTASNYLLFNGKTVTELMHGFEWYNAVRIYLSAYGALQQLDIYLYDAAFDGLNLYEAGFTFEILSGAVDGDGSPLSPAKYFYAPENQNVYPLKSSYGLVYFRQTLLKDSRTENRTLDINKDSTTDIRDLVRLKKALASESN